MTCQAMQMITIKMITVTRKKLRILYKLCKLLLLWNEEEITLEKQLYGSAARLAKYTLCAFFHNLNRSDEVKGFKRNPPPPNL